MKRWPSRTLELSLIMRDSLLDRLARERGIGDAYHDYRGELKHISRATKARILEVMGCHTDDAATLQRELDELEAERWRALLPPVVVIGPGRIGAAVTLALDVLDRPLQWRVDFAAGGAAEGRARAADLHELGQRVIDGHCYSRRLLPMPESLPPGYHRLSLLAVDGTRAACTLIVAPDCCHEPEALTNDGRLWGVAVQLYTLRSARNWGMGDFADLETVVRRCAARGAAFVGLNPLHALFPANPPHCSPYSPSSRQFLNVFYIAVERLPEFVECEPARERMSGKDFQAELARLRATPFVDYAGVAAVKMPVLRMLYAHFRSTQLAHGTARAAAFQAFVAERGRPLHLHAVHDAIDEYLRERDPDHYWGWRVWPGELRDPSHSGVAGFAAAHAAAVEFHAWLQWVADGQLGDVQRLARALGMPLGLYGDFAVGVNPSGSETWSDPAVYRTGAAIGAPPDALALMGQDWGLLPQDPHALMVAGYRPFRELVAANMRHFGALRLDHVMALCRQWWVPVGLDATEGGYVRYPLGDLMAVLTLESRRHACLVVGEDLGTVPDEMAHAMAACAVYSYKVLLFEKYDDGVFRRPQEYERRAVAAVTTHDLPTLRSYWNGDDLPLRDRLGLYPDDDIRRRVWDERERDRKQLASALEDTGLQSPQFSGPGAPYDEDLARAIHLYLARSAAALVVLQIEDMIGMNDPVNVPGTSDEYPNWQRKVSAGLDEIFDSQRVEQLLRAVQQARAG